MEKIKIYISSHIKLPLGRWNSTQWYWWYTEDQYNLLYVFYGYELFMCCTQTVSGPIHPHCHSWFRSLSLCGGQTLSCTSTTDSLRQICLSVHISRIRICTVGAIDLNVPCFSQNFRRHLLYKLENFEIRNKLPRWRKIPWGLEILEFILFYSIYIINNISHDVNTRVLSLFGNDSKLYYNAV